MTENDSFLSNKPSGVFGRSPGLRNNKVKRQDEAGMDPLEPGFKKTSIFSHSPAELSKVAPGLSESNLESNGGDVVVEPDCFEINANVIVREQESAEISESEIIEEEQSLESLGNVIVEEQETMVTLSILETFDAITNESTGNVSDISSFSVHQHSVTKLPDTPIKESTGCEVGVHVSDKFIASLKGDNMAFLNSKALVIVADDFPLNDEAFQKEVLRVDYMSLESVVNSQFQSAISRGRDLDIAVSGPFGVRSTCSRILNVFTRTSPNLHAKYTHALNVLASFGSNSLDTSLSDQSLGFTTVSVDPATGHIIDLAIVAATLSPFECLQGRLFNVFHQLIATKKALYLEGIKDEDQVASFLRVINSLGEVHIRALQNNVRTDYFGFYSLSDSLVSLGFSQPDIDRIWDTCLGVLFLVSGESEWMEQGKKLIGLTSAEMDSNMWSIHEIGVRAYELLFNWLVCRINMALADSLPVATTDGVIAFRVYELSDSAHVTFHWSPKEPSLFPTVASMFSDEYRNARYTRHSLQATFEQRDSEKFVVYPLSFSELVRQGNSLEIRRFDLARCSEKTMAACFPNLKSSVYRTLSPSNDDDEEVTNFGVAPSDWDSLLAKDLIFSVLRFLNKSSYDVPDRITLQTLLQRIKFVCLAVAHSLDTSDFDVLADVESALNEFASEVKHIWSIEDALRCLDDEKSFVNVLEVVLKARSDSIEHPQLAKLEDFVLVFLKRCREEMNVDVCQMILTAVRDRCLPVASTGPVGEILKSVMAFASLDRHVQEKATLVSDTRAKIHSSDPHARRLGVSDLCRVYVEHPDMRLQNNLASRLSKLRPAPLAKQTAIYPMSSRESLMAQIKKHVSTRSASFASRIKSSQIVSRIKPISSATLPGSGRLGQLASLLLGDSDSMKKFVIRKVMADLLTSLTADPIAFHSSAFRLGILSDALDLIKAEALFDAQGFEYKTGVGRLAFIGCLLLAFDFARDGHTAEDMLNTIAILIAITNELNLPDDVRSCLKDFLFGLDPLCAEVEGQSRIKTASGSNSSPDTFFSRKRVEDVWNRFGRLGSIRELPVETFAAKGEVRKMPLAEAQALMISSVRSTSATSVEGMEAGNKHAISNTVSDLNQPGFAEGGYASQSPKIEQDRKIVKNPQISHIQRRREEWKATHVNCKALYDYSDPDGDTTYLSIRKAEILWIPIVGPSNNSPLSTSQDWVWVERYCDDPNDVPLDDKTQLPLQMSGYVPFKYVGFPGYDEQ